MAKLTKFLVLIAALGILALGCQNQPNMVEPQSAPPAPPAKITLANGATFDSATLYVHILDVSGQSVNVHRITSDWDEGTVTWNNFGGSYAPAVEGSFVADAYDWRTVDLTSLVESWMLGTYDNFGVLLDQVTKAFPRTRYFAHESSINIPFLRVCYSTSGGTVCDDYPAIADAYIHELNPDFNNGYAATFYTGWAFDTDLEKQAMLRFDLPTIPQLAAIGDTVWYDDNNDGIQDGGELGAPGVTVNLYDCADNLIATTVTNADGFYMFSDLTPGDYYVEFILPGGYTFSPQDQGMDDAKDSDADPTTGKTACTTLDAGEYDMTWDAGLYEELEYGECDGKVTQLTVRYDGSIVDAHIVVMQKKGIVVFDGIVQPGGQFTFYGADNKGTFGPETYYYVNGVYNTNIHTSCSQPIGPGLTKGDFTVIEGYSRNGGLLPPL